MARLKMEKDQVTVFMCRKMETFMKVDSKKILSTTKADSRMPMVTSTQETFLMAREKEQALSSTLTELSLRESGRTTRSTEMGRLQLLMASSRFLMRMAKCEAEELMKEKTGPDTKAFSHSAKSTARAK